MQVPTTEEEWKKVATKFHQCWNFPRCIGALDGKHIQIKHPSKSGAYFYNFKGHYSIILLALVDANYCFQYIDVGTNGRAGDSTVFQESTLGMALEQNLLNLPPDHVIVGDDAFPLKTYLMKRYPSSRKSIKKKVFNYRQSRACNIVENAFGILASRFRIFLRPNDVLPSTVDKVVWASCSIHNWLRKTSKKTYTPPGSVDTDDFTQVDLIPGLWRSVTPGLYSVSRAGSNNYRQEAENICESYASYFCNEGVVPWQWKKIGMEVSEDYEYLTEEEDVDGDLLTLDELMGDP